MSIKTELDENGSPTNRQRAEWAHRALSLFATDVGMSERDITEDFLTVAGDFLADLFHLADEHGIDIDELVGRGRYHHDAEVNGED